MLNGCCGWDLMCGEVGSDKSDTLMGGPGNEMLIFNATSDNDLRIDFGGYSILLQGVAFAGVVGSQAY